MKRSNPKYSGRKLRIEGLEKRRMLVGDVDIFLDLPPDSYLDPKLDVYISRLNWEFDEWNASPVVRGPFTQSQDRRVVLEDGRALIVLTASQDGVEAFKADLNQLGAELISGAPGELHYFASAWVPLPSLDALGNVSGLLRASIIDHGVQTLGTDSVGVTTKAWVLGTADSLPESRAAVATKWDKLGGPLSGLAAAAEKNRLLRLPDSNIDETLYQVEGNQILVTAVSKDLSSGELSRHMQAVGADIVGEYADGVDAWISLQALPQLQAIEGLTHVTAAMRPMVATGVTTTQGDASVKADRVRSQLNFNGQGVKVGVLSDSYNRLGTAATDVASGDLPSNVNVVAEGPTNLSDEGRAMLQIIHDLAPAASLLFATAYSTALAFQSNILALAAAGADVIVDDIQYFNEPMFLDGPIAQAVNTVTGQGVVYVSAAGNSGTNSYENLGFRSSSTTADYGRGAVSLFDFNSGAGDDYLQSITVPASRKVTISLQWDDPFISYAAASGGAQRDLDLLVLDAAGTSILYGSAAYNIGGDPLEVVTIAPSPVQRTLNLAIGGYTSSGLGRLKYVIHDSFVNINEYSTNSSTNYGHANAAGAIAVGAANALSSTSPPTLQSYSSSGGTPILFNSQGTRLPTAEIRQSPDVVGPDNVNTTFFGTDSGLDSDTFPNFIGTSAAAPHVAAVAALMLQAAPTATPAAISAALTSTAVNMLAPGFDNTTGFGYVDALSAAYKILTPSQAPDLVSSSDTGIQSTDNITSITTPTFSGSAPLGSYVRLFVDGSERAAVALGPTQTAYSLTSSSLIHGSHLAYVTFAASSTTAQSASSPVLAITVDTIAPSFVGSIDLLASRDSGVSNSDNITNLSPIFSVSGADSYLRLTRNGSTVVGYLSNGNITLGAPSQGSNFYLLRAVDLAGNLSTGSTGLTLVFDSVPPTVTITPVSPDPRATSVSDVAFGFSESDLLNFDINDLWLTRNGSSNLLTASQSVQATGGVWSVNGLTTLTSVAGVYSLNFNTATSGIVDRAGNLLVNVGVLSEQWTYVSWQNAAFPEDVDASGFVAALDVLIIVNFINAYGTTSTVNNPNLPAAPPPYFDVSNDQLISALDTLLVVNYINSHPNSRVAAPSSESLPGVSTFLFDFKAVDIKGQPIQKVAVGEEFRIEGYVSEKSGESVFAAYIDFLVDSNIEVVAIESDYLLAASGTRTSEPGDTLISDLGGIISLAPSDTESVMFFTIRVVATMPGPAKFVASTPANGTMPVALAFGSNGLDPASKVRFNDLQILVVGAAAPQIERGVSALYATLALADEHERISIAGPGTVIGQLQASGPSRPDYSPGLDAWAVDRLMSQPSSELQIDEDNLDAQDSMLTPLLYDFLG